MKISFAVIACVIFCGIEVTANGYEEKCKKPKEAYIPTTPWFGQVDVRNEGKYNGEGELLDEPKRYRVTVVSERNVPFIKKMFDYEWLNLDLRTVEFTPTNFDGNKGIAVKITFVKHRCDLILNADIKSTPRSTRRVNSKLQDYLKNTNFETKEATQHNIKWLDDVYRGNEKLMVNTMQSNRWVREVHTGQQTLLAEQHDIDRFLTTTGLN